MTSIHVNVHLKATDNIVLERGEAHGGHIYIRLGDCVVHADEVILDRIRYVIQSHLETVGADR